MSSYKKIIVANHKKHIYLTRNHLDKIFFLLSFEQNFASV